MTEIEWLGHDAKAMIILLKDSGRLGMRKARLFNASLCRDAWGLLVDERHRTAIDVAERYGDGMAGDAERSAAEEAAAAAHRDLMTTWRPPITAATACLVGHDSYQVELAFALAAHWPEEVVADRIREIFGNPFHPARVDSTWQSWRADIVFQLAATAYENRCLPSGRLESQRVSVLADALEEAGCPDSEILLHLRNNSGSHVRGCHIIDLILGRE